MNPATLLQRADIWRGGQLPAASGVSSGFVALDALLPGSGFPLGALTEVVVPRPGVGELRLVLPAAIAAARRRWLALIAPPYIPYAPALARAGVNLGRLLVVHARARSENLWAIEQALRAGACGAVLAWPGQIDLKWLRRLQLAAETGEALGILFAPPSSVVAGSAAALRLRLEPQPEGLAVHILKRRGGWPAGPVSLDWSTLRQGRRLRREVNHAVAVPRSASARARGLRARARHA